MNEAVTMALRYHHPDQYQGMRAFYASVYNALPVGAQRLPAPELAQILRAFHLTYQSGWNTAYDSQEPSRALADPDG